MINEDELVIDEDVDFYHDISSNKNRNRRRNKGLKWRNDRKSWKKYPMTDVKFCKKMLHRQMRRELDIAASTYHKGYYSLYGTCYALT